MRLNLQKFVLAGLLALGMSASVPDAAGARALEATEKTGLAATVDDFNRAMSAKNLEGIAKVLPPRVLQSFSDTAKVPVEDVRKAMMDVMKMTFASVILDSFSMDLAAAQYKELANGTPYVLIPTETVIAVPGEGKVSQKTHSLALMDGGIWYLLRVNEAQQLVILKQVYPEFAGVEFPQGSMEVLKK